MRIATAIAILALSAAPAWCQFTNSTAGQPGTKAVGTLAPGQTAALELPPLPGSAPWVATYGPLQYPLLCSETYEWEMSNKSDQPIRVALTAGTRHSQSGGCPMKPYTGDHPWLTPGVVPVNAWNAGFHVTIAPHDEEQRTSNRRDEILIGSCGAAPTGPYTMAPGTDGQSPTLAMLLINPSNQPVDYMMHASWTCNCLGATCVQAATPTPSPSPTSTPTPMPSVTPSPSPS